MGQRGTHRLACPAQPRPDWKPHPWTIHFFIGQDAFETGATSPMPERGDAPEGEPAVRKPRGYDLDTARREAPGPWRIGGRDDEGSRGDRPSIGQPRPLRARAFSGQCRESTPGGLCIPPAPVSRCSVRSTEKGKEGRKAEHHTQEGATPLAAWWLRWVAKKV